MKRLRPLVVIPAGPVNPADVPTPSFDILLVPFPASVVTSPVASTSLRTVQLPPSAMYRGEAPGYV